MPMPAWSTDPLPPNGSHPTARCSRPSVGRAPASPCGCQVPGAHFGLNALAAHVVLCLLGLRAAGGRGLAGRPTGERSAGSSVVGAAGGVVVYDDYGHHPTEMRATVSTARETLAGRHCDGRLVVLYRPLRYTRTQRMAPELGAALGGADVVVVLDPSGDPPIDGVSGAQVAEAVPLPADRVHYRGDTADGVAVVTDVAAARRPAAHARRRRRRPARAAGARGSRRDPSARRPDALGDRRADPAGSDHPPVPMPRRPSLLRATAGSARSWSLPAALAVVAGIGWLLLFSSVFGVGRVVVSGGSDAVAAGRRQAASHRRAAAAGRRRRRGPAGSSPVCPNLEQVTVTRDWPGTLRVQVTPAGPLLAVRTPSGVEVLDHEGVVLLGGGDAAGDLPTLSDAGSPAAGCDGSDGAAGPAGQGRFAGRIGECGQPGVDQRPPARRPHDRVGERTETDKKVRVLKALLSVQARVYDVSAPDLPTTAG